MSITRVNVTDHSDEFIDAKNTALEKALIALGIHLEGEAKEELQNSPNRVDTGRLRNSITYAIMNEHDSGSPGTGYSEKYHRPNEGSADDWATRSQPEPGSLYVGTNVEYGIYIHEGTKGMAPNRFLKNAFERNKDQAKQYVEKALKGT